MRIRSGTGEDLGTLIEVVNDRFGIPKWIAFLESPHAPPRKVRLDVVRSVREGVVELRGPREGYHITRLHR